MLRGGWRGVLACCAAGEGGCLEGLEAVALLGVVVGLWRCGGQHVALLRVALPSCPARAGGATRGPTLPVPFSYRVHGCMARAIGFL